ncbi:MAG: GNAT family protein [Actinomycetaceae bacterium]|nr:GNAT family protein [Actinomycetaceae bacterium]
MSVGDWWWDLTHAPLVVREERASERGLVSGGEPIEVIELREARADDLASAERLRSRHRDWLAPWEATAPAGYDTQIPGLAAYTRLIRRQRREGRCMPFALRVDDVHIGQVTVAEITRAASHCGTVGYWIVPGYARRGIMTAAVAMALDACFADLCLHRVEINIRPENAPSLAIARRLGLRYEGVRVGYLHIGEAWADHVAYAAVVDDVPPGGFVTDLVAQRRKLGC